MKLHVKTCLRSGWTKREIGEMLLHVYVYAGVYPSLSAFATAHEAIKEYKAEKHAARKVARRR